MRDLTTTAHDVLLHATGYNRGPRERRNHYVTGPEPLAAIDELVAAGLMVQTRTPGFLDPTDRNFAATEAGLAEARAERERREPKLTRSQRRYRRWASLADAYDISFGDWLKTEDARSV